MYSCYTLSPCIFSTISDNQKRYWLSLIEIFAKEDSPRLAIDNQNKIIKMYHTSIKKLNNDSLLSGLEYWLYLMSTKPTKWTKISPDNDNNDVIILDVCSKTVDKRLIVSNIDSCNWTTKITSDHTIEYNKQLINIIDRETAISELSPVPANQIINTLVAKEGSSISKVKING